MYRPMDLLKMEEKLDNGEYQTFNDFRNDFKLIVNNCRLYNGQNNGKDIFIHIYAFDITFNDLRSLFNYEVAKDSKRRSSVKIS